MTAPPKGADTPFFEQHLIRSNDLFRDTKSETETSALTLRYTGLRKIEPSDGHHRLVVPDYHIIGVAYCDSQSRNNSALVSEGKDLLWQATHVFERREANHR